jgi:type IV pilus assembly protein PilB
MNPLAHHFGAEEIDLRNVQFTPELLASIPAKLARRYRVLPVVDSPRMLRIALADQAELDTIDALAHLLRRELELCVAEASQLDDFVNRLYGSEEREG